MKKAFALSFLIFSLLSIISCTKPTPTLENIDITVWVEDKNACNGKRAAMYGEMDQQKDKLIGLTEIKIAALLGTPDEYNLYKRNQKFYYYYLQPSATCKSGNITNPKKLLIRFTAMGIAKEVSIIS
jgi:hypothetical protein